MIARIKNILTEHWAVSCLFVIGFVLRFCTALSDSFLHPWDERFHALVARNMMDHPFKPMLLANPILPGYDFTQWCCNHIWLHKQPLFLWQMAISMKIFGVSEIAMRLPSVLMGTVMILLTYRIALLLFSNNKTIALLSATMMSFSCFSIQLSAGIQSMDHNDVAHQLYILASIWAFAEYTRKPGYMWAILVGLLAGAAVLNKWLTGLLVFLAWGLFIGSRYKKVTAKELLHGIAGVGMSILVFLPWQLYIFSRFPAEARYELNYTNRHLYEAVEGHTGTWLYYVKQLADQINPFLCCLIIPGILYSFWRKGVKKELHIAFIGCIVFVVAFYSFVVTTKVQAFVFFIAPLLFLYSSFVLANVVHFLAKYRVMPVMMVLVAFLSVNLNKFRSYYASDHAERNMRSFNASVYKNLKTMIPNNTQVVINMNSYEDKDIMFYNPGIVAYHWVPSKEDMLFLAGKKIRVAAFKDHDDYRLPDYVLSYPYLTIIDVKLFSFK
jgi:4-amino-4-deoxy-L-arabinose transferase